MSIISETMKKWADENEIALDEVQLEKFEDYAKSVDEAYHCLLYTSPSPRDTR